jgi:hypothetical protein
MKTPILVLTAFFLINMTVFGQAAKDIPAAVKTSFSQKFPKATNVEWGNENDKEWEAEFKMDGKEYSANFDNEGTWIETEYEISAKEIPSAVKATLDKESAGYKTAESVVTENKDGKAFEFLLKKGETEIELIVDSKGKVIKKEQAEKEDEEDEEK